MRADLTSLLKAETAKPVDAAISAMAKSILPNHKNVVAILAYGSTLRDVKPDESLIDLYVLTETVDGVSGNPISQLGCATVPPNVYYAECQHDGKTYRAKYAALALRNFARRVSLNTSNPYFWARFAQPCRIVWSAGTGAHEQVIAALVNAATTAMANAKYLSGGSAQQQWAALFQNTYRTELRPEASNRADLVVAANLDYYSSVSALLDDTKPKHASWARRRFTGKALSVLRLIKASFTFQGGADYIAWKIKRHSGVVIEVKDWHRRHPLLAGLVLLPKLLGKGAIK
jgi:hypothetical protein